MQTAFILLCIASLLSCVVSLVLLLIWRLRKEPFKKPLLVAMISLVLSVVGFTGALVVGGSSVRDAIGILIFVAGILGAPVCGILLIVALIHRQRRRFTVITTAVSIAVLFLGIILMPRMTPEELAAHNAEQLAKKTTQSQPIPTTKSSPTVAETTRPQITQPQTATTIADQELKLLVSKMNLSTTEAEHVKNTLHSIGLSPLASCVPEKGVTGAYTVTCNNASATVIVEAGRVKYCYSGDVTLYDTSDGGKKANIQDYVIDPSKKAYYISYAQDYVKQGLKSPSTAEFPGTFWSVDDCTVARYKDTVTVQSYVDSQNSFGAMVRSNFKVQLSFADCSCKYLEIDGSVLYKE